MPANPIEWAEVRDDNLVVCVSRAVYTDEAIFRTCYVFTDRCYLFLEQAGPDRLSIRFRRRQNDADLHRVVGEFSNELINQRLRIDLARETRDIRQLIVARAFADAEFERQ